jgi:hypothetical protein
LGFDASALIAGLIEIEIKGTEELAYERYEKDPDK